MHRDRHSLLRGWRRIRFFVSNFAIYILPNAIFRWAGKRFLDHLTETERAAAQSRADYYCRLPETATVADSATAIGSYKFPFREKHKFTAYFFDLYSALKYFSKSLKFYYLFGDVSWNEAQPTLVKSRPISPTGSMNVVMKLNRMRHFFFIDDRMSFNDKLDQIVFRNVVRGQQWREAFVSQWIGHPMCNIGATNADCGHKEWQADYLSMAEQLQYKFIATIEGNDVATNLKWVMSSNSIAVMPRPRMESWFMEGRLIPNYHYIEIRSDYSDLTDRLQYYIDHPTEAQEIIDHAHEWIAQFGNKRIEKAAQLLTLKNYFRQTRQSIDQ